MNQTLGRVQSWSINDYQYFDFIQNQTQLNEAFDLLLHNEDERLEKGHICSTFVQMNKGATQTIMNHILN